jgi:hypothetical protein
MLTVLGRKVKIIDLDPANENQLYTSDATIQDLVKVEEVMEEFQYGFNAALIYCMEFLETHEDWLIETIKSYDKGTFVILDLPGQVELFIHNRSLKNIFESFERRGIMMCSIYLVDSNCCSDPGKFIAFLITTLMSMCHIELPRVNLLSKCDMIPKHEDKLAFNLEFYTSVLDLDKLVALVDDDPITGRYKKLTKAFASVIESYGLVQFTPVSMSDKESLTVALKLADKSVGYLAENDDNLVQAYMASTDGQMSDLVAMMNEKYVIPDPVQEEIQEKFQKSLVIRERDEKGEFVDKAKEVEEQPVPSSSKSPEQPGSSSSTNPLLP